MMQRGLARHGGAWHGWARLGSAWLGEVSSVILTGGVGFQRGMARRGWAGLG